MKLPRTWYAIDATAAMPLEAELRRELPVTHQLHGCELRAIARRERRDDVLFQTADDRGPVFWVHLTWRVETDPSWPSTERYESMDEFLERWPREELDEEPEDGA